ncbi:hypothetical protein Q428_02340 [Fervidicella metallireducens AeB]|uniref:YNCE-like beta-propeller domain-containing protein n=1 Tax=Fervidicella metallireducens AeB TaxID=1403537 RepID=A0A017RY37_9CLOT|nr:carboxypeptidase regulatory-like domain-containing protein [Fervidicella metallireducens]EYE89491.1 hypothetical protein Q428_02340 [Fervidicella metallireducens AeB]
MPLKAFTLFVPNRSQNTVSVIDTLNNRILQTITVGVGPSNVVMTSDGKTAITLNTDGNTLSFIDTENFTVKDTVAVGNSPINAVITPDDKYIFVINRDDETIYKVNIKSAVVEATLPLGFRPTRITMKSDGSVIYTAGINGNNICVIDAATCSIITRIRLPQQINYVPVGLKLTPDDSVLIYVSSSSPMILAVDTTTNQVAQPVYSVNSQMFIPQDVVISSDGKNAFVVGISKTAGLIMKFKTSLPLGLSGSKYIFSIPYKVNISRDEKYLITSNTTSRNVYIFDINNLENYTPIYTGGTPSDIINDLTQNMIYIVNKGLEEVTCISTETKTIFTSYPVGQNPSTPAGAVINVPVPPYLITKRPYYTETEGFNILSGQKIIKDVVLNKVQGTPGIIQGTVLDSYNFPVKGASVFIRTEDGHVFDKVSTSDTGTYSFSLVKMEEEYEIIVSSPDFHYSKESVVEVEPGTVKILDFKLDEDVFSTKGVISGCVLNENGDSIENAVINVFKIDQGYPPIFKGHAFTNNSGEFYIPLLERGGYAVIQVKNGYLPNESLVIIDKEGQVTTVTNKLTIDPSNPSAEVSGTIRYEDGNVAANATVELYIIEGNKEYLYSNQRTDENGRYSFTKLKPGTYFLEIFKMINEGPDGMPV